MGKGQRLIPVLIVLIVASAAAHSQQSKQREVAPVESQTPTATQQRGTYQALVIGIDNYQNLPKLGTAVSDAKSIAKVLQKQYGFNVTLLTDADGSYQKIVGALSDYVHKLQENDNLLIYYAGHGMYDKETDTAYWLPVDAEPDDDVYWIIANVITTHVHAIRARHVLVVSDSCYSGMLTRSVNLAPKSTDPAEYIQNMLRGRSRHLMSSGGNEPVADGGAPGHSVFSSAFLRALKGMNEDAFTATDLFGMVQRQVAGGSEQVPQYMPIRDSGDVEGDFVFFQSQASAIKGSRPGAETGATSQPTAGTTTNQEDLSRQTLMAMQPRPENQSAAPSQSNRPAAVAGRPAPSGPNFGGTWIEINPKNPENPRNLVLQQDGEHIAFAGFRLTVKQGVATFTGPQGCSPRFRRTGYDYPSSNVVGIVTLTMSLQGSTLVYENEVNYRLPCDGHAVGDEPHISRFQRAVPETPAQQQRNEPSSGFRVAQVNLYPTPGSYEGHCPIAIRYRGVIVASGPGTVRYTFVRSDNATAPISTLQFESAGAKEVSDTWQVGGSGRTLELWRALRILDPGPAVESNKAITTLVCEGGGSDGQGPSQQSLREGQDTCKQGFVWREAAPNDHVCVTPQVREQAASDNEQASARKNPNGGQYGPDTCKQGFVWRKATPSDHVCVIGETRAQAKADNSQAVSRRQSP
jgi:hypothetical protein